LHQIEPTLFEKGSLKLQTRKMVAVLSAAALSTTLLLSGCGTAKNDNNAGTTGTTKSSLKVAMVTDVGGIHDNSFNQSAWEGLQRAQKDLGITIKNVESHQVADYATNLTSFVKSNYDLTWGIGFAMADDLSKVAADNPKQKLGIIDSDLGGKIPSNVAAVTFQEEQGSFLEGVIAGLMTKSNKIGFIGGMNVPLINKFEAGFRAGVYAVKPDAKVQVAYADAFDKPDKGRVLAAGMYNNGVDIIYHAAGATGDGVFQEAKSRGKGYWVIGVDRDESYLAPDNTLSSMVKHVDNAVYDVTKMLSENKFPGGKDTVLGLKEDGVGYASTTKDHVPADILAKVDQFKSDIVAGKITVPATLDALKQFQATYKK
jgi:basic membrane protein A